MVARIERGATRISPPDIFMSHSSRDKTSALNLARTLNMCSVDVWLDDWEMEIGQSLTDEIAKAMEKSRYIAILITENYNKTVWTKKEYKKAIAREEKEKRNVMLPIIVGQAQIPDFIEDKLYVDMRTEFYSGIVKLVGLVRGVSKYRISESLSRLTPGSISDVWRVLESVGIEPYVVVGQDDFDEIMKYGGVNQDGNYGTFSPDRILTSEKVSEHVKDIMRFLVEMPIGDSAKMLKGSER